MIYLDTPGVTGTCGLYVRDAFEIAVYGVTLGAVQFTCLPPPASRYTDAAPAWGEGDVVVASTG